MQPKRRSEHQSSSLYLRWNDELSNRLFNTPVGRYERFWLRATPEMIFEVGEAIGSDRTDLVRMLASGAPWITSKHSRFIPSALAAKQNWRNHGFKWPPYVHYLSVLSACAADEDGAEAIENYFRRYWTFLGQHQRGGIPPAFERTIELWQDLENWLRVDKAGQYGTLLLNTPGVPAYLGVPLSQHALLQDELNQIESLFRTAGLTPGQHLTSEALVQTILSAAQQQQILSRVRHAILDPPSARDRDVLQSVITDSFQQWGGTPIKKTPVSLRRSRAPHEAPASGSLRLTVRLDRLRNSASVGMRINMPGFPSERLLLKDSNDRQFECDEDSPGWSTILLDSKSLEHADAATASSWLSTYRLQSNDGYFTFTRRASDLRVLVDAADYGLSYLVEDDDIEDQQSVILLAYKSCVAEIDGWLRRHGVTGAKQKPVTGLPPGWHLRRVSELPDIGDIAHLLPASSAPKRARISLIGGIRAEGVRTNRYLPFALPAIRLRGTTEELRLALNDTWLTQTADREFALPTDLLQNTIHRLEARTSSGEIAARLGFEIAEILLPDPTTIATAAESLGESWQGRRDLILIQEFRDEVEAVGSRGVAPTYLLVDGSGTSRIWGPTQELDVNFHPVWAVRPRPPRPAIYCSDRSIQSLERPNEYFAADSRWKSVVQGKHDQFAAKPPEDIQLAQLWEHYVRASDAR